MNNEDFIKEAERNLSENTYFQCRRMLDGKEARKIFCDGFDRGWRAVAAKESVQRFLKDGETIEQCLIRNRKYIDTLLELLAKEREKHALVPQSDDDPGFDAFDGMGG